MRVRIEALVCVLSLGGPGPILAQDAGVLLSPAADSTDGSSSPPPAGSRPEVGAATAAPELPSNPGVSSAGQPVYETIVTGSRVPRRDLTSPGPVVTYSHEEITRSGAPSIGDFLQTVPWQGGGENNQFYAGGDGTTQISLRNLGARYTLVLVDGKRWVYGGLGPGSIAVPAFDVNVLSTSLVDRIEVLKDGASAVYGSDAIAGVVNIITRKRMDGVEVDGYAGLSSHGDAVQASINGSAGVSNERGGFLLSFGYLHQDPLLAAERSWSNRAVFYNFANGTVTPGGTTQVPAGTAVVDPSKCTTQLCQRLNGAYPGAGRTTWIADGNPGLGVPVVTDPVTGQQWRKFVASGANNDLYNDKPYNDLINPSERLYVFGNGDYRLGEVARVKMQAAWMRNESGFRSSTEPFSTAFAPGASLDPTNPYNPFGLPVTVASKRLDVLVPRERDSDSQTIELNTGVDGTVAATDWSLSVGYGRSSTSQTQLGSVDLSKVASAIGPAHQDASGHWQCGAPGTSIPGCTPANLFGVGSLTPQMAKALGAYTGLAEGFSELIAFNGDLNRDLFFLWANRPAAVAMGYEFRHEAGGYQSDAVAVANNTIDWRSQPTKGQYNVHEIYGELNLPLVSKIPFAEDLEVQGAVRWSHYSTFGSNTSYKLGARWVPVRGLTLRGTYGTGFRAPAIDDVFGPQLAAFGNATDPCASIPASNQALRSQCAAGPAGAAAVNNGDTRNVLPATTGGNPALKPETSDSATVGTVIEPLKRLSLTLDYYWIRVHEAIARNVGSTVIFNGCYPARNGSTAAPDPNYCNVIIRDPTTGLIQNIYDLRANAGTILTSGLDLALRYALDTGAGRFGFWGEGNYLIRQDLVRPNGQVIRGAGNYDLKNINPYSGLTPRVRFNTGIDHALGPFTAGVELRFIGGFEECAPASGSTATGGGLCADQNKDPQTGVPYPVHHVDAYAAFDLYVGYSVKSAIGSTKFSVGVRNVFDAKPPTVYDSFLGYADPGYDFVGRFFWARITHKF